MNNVTGFLNTVNTCRLVLWEEVPVNGLFQEVLGSTLYVKIGPMTYKRLDKETTWHTTCKRVYYRGMNNGR